jgi:hypothetical protein
MNFFIIITVDTLIVIRIFVTGIIECVLQKSNKPYENVCGLDCYKKIVK